MCAKSPEISRPDFHGSVFFRGCRSGDYREGFVTLEPGDVLVIYSDGASENLNEAGEEFGEARLIEITQKNRGRTAAGLRDRIDEALTRFQGKAKSVDDLTLVILKRKSLEE